MSLTDTRQLMRSRRRALGHWQRQRAARALAGNACRLPHWHRAGRIGLYLANDGEIDPVAIARLAWRQGKRCYLPVVLDQGAMEFRLWYPQQRLLPNRFGILEPTLGVATCPVRQLDILFVPLVAFDSAGNRLGMGGGYYDRLLAFRQHQPWSAPLLAGLAYSFQQVGSMEPDPWDIPLDAIVTEAGIIPGAYSRKRR